MGTAVTAECGRKRVGVCAIIYVCVCDRENGIITSRVNKGKQLGHKRMTWPTDFNAAVS